MCYLGSWFYTDTQEGEWRGVASHNVLYYIDEKRGDAGKNLRLIVHSRTIQIIKTR